MQLWEAVLKAQRPHPAGSWIRRERFSRQAVRRFLQSKNKGFRSVQAARTEVRKDPSSLEGDAVPMPSSGPVDQKTTLPSATCQRLEHCSSSSPSAHLLIGLGEGSHTKSKTTLWASWKGSLQGRGNARRSTFSVPPRSPNVGQKSLNFLKAQLPFVFVWPPVILSFSLSQTLRWLSTSYLPRLLTAPFRPRERGYGAVMGWG